MAKIKLGIAPIAWTNDDMPDLGKENTFEQCVSEMALAGYEGCEIGNKYPKDPNVLKKALDLRGLQIASAWFSSYLLTQPYEQVEKDFRAHCAFLQAMGAKFCNVAEQGTSVQGKLDVPVFAGKPVNTEEQWKTLTEGLDKLGKVAKEDYGLTMTYASRRRPRSTASWTRRTPRTSPCFMIRAISSAPARIRSRFSRSTSRASAISI